MSKTVIIPDCMNPFEVIVNGKHYSYPAGTTQEVPDDVAAVIEAHEQVHEEQTVPPPPTDGGILDEDGKINPSFLPNHRVEMGMPLNYFVNPQGAAGDTVKFFPVSPELEQIIVSAIENCHPINLVFTGEDHVDEIVCQAVYHHSEQETTYVFYVNNFTEMFEIYVDATDKTICAHQWV